MLRRNSVFLSVSLVWLFSLHSSAAADLISSSRVTRASFNPSAAQETRLLFQLETPGKITVSVWDSDGGLVRQLLVKESLGTGEQKVVWDGRDLDGQVVPDEAYYFTVENSAGDTYDPTTFSGGVVGSVTQGVEFDREAGTIGYRLPVASRVLIRLGVTNGPMFRTLVDWKPRVVGAITEYWQGRDEDGVFDVWSHPGFSGLITYSSLPDTSVIAFGNKAETYRDYKLGRAKNRPQKPERLREGDPNERRPLGLVPPAWARAPRVSLGFPTLVGDSGSAKVPEIREKVAVRVDADPADKDRLVNDQFEVIFYVDGVFFSEAERGYFPLNWVWETHQLPPGEHVLTVNVTSLKGQVGVASRKVLVRERP